MGKKRKGEEQFGGGGRRRPMLDLGGFGSLRRGEREEEEEEEEPQENGAAVDVGGGTAGAGAQPGGGWTVVTDEASGDTYYWNTVTGQTTWEKPKELAGWEEEGQEEAAAAAAAAAPGDVAVDADANAEQSKAAVRDDTGPGGLALLGLSGYGSESGGEDEEGTKEGEEKEHKVKEEDKVEFKVPQPVKMQLKPKQATVSKKPLVPNVFSKAKQKAAAESEQPKEEENSRTSAGGAEGGVEGDGGDVDEFMRELDAARPAVSVPGPAKSQTKANVVVGDSDGIVIKGSSQSGKSNEEGNYDPCDAGSDGDDDVNEFLRELEKPGGKRKCPTCGRQKGDQNEREEAKGEDEDEGRWLAVCGEMVLELRQKGDVVVEMLRGAVGEEEIVVGGRRDALLALLGAMDTLNESIVELGALVVENQSESFSQQIAAYLPSMKARMSALESSADALLKARAEDHIQVLPKGWDKAYTTDEGRVIFVHHEDGLVQAHPPPGTTLETVAKRIMEKAQSAEAAKVKAAEKAAEQEEGEVDEVSAAATSESKPDEVEKMRQALPPADGKPSLDSMLVYFHPSPECTVPRIQALFLDRRIFMIRSIGSGFAAVTFCDSLECELARWQALAATSGGKASQSGSVKDWVVFSTAPVLAFGRAATDKDAISRYPVTFAGAPPPISVASSVPQSSSSSVRADPAPASALTQHSHQPPRSVSPYENASGRISPFEAMLAGDEPRGGAQQGAASMCGDGFVGGLTSVMSAGAGAGGKGEKVKTSGRAKVVSSKFAKQMEVWKSKRSELQDQEEEDGAMTLEKLEREREKKANQWFQDQVLSGAVGDDNPNFIPVQKMFTPY